MNILKTLTVATALVLSTNVNAVTITHGYLTTDDTTSVISDIHTGREYMRFDEFNLSVEDTVAATMAGGIYDGWHIATSDIADDFISSALGMTTTPCTGITTFGVRCGSLNGYVDGDFGASVYPTSTDAVWYFSNNYTPGGLETVIGQVALNRNRDTGQFAVWDYSSWSNESTADYYGGATNPTQPLNALLYRDVSTVPVPAAVWLFGSGLIGLVGFARRKGNS